MQRQIDNRITYHENSVAVAKTLRENGYEIADCVGNREDEPNQDVIGILKPRESIQKKFFGFTWYKPRRALHVGNLWLDDSTRGAKLYENWVMEVYGRENVLELTKLVKKLSEPHQVKVKIKLDSEIPGVESFSSDYGY